MTLLNGEYGAEQCHPDLPCGRRRHRGSGLGGDAVPHVRAAARHNWTVKVLGLSGGRRGGHQSHVHSGGGAQRLRFFAQRKLGVHRTVRVSPFDASGRRHTSFASLEVVPEGRAITGDQAGGHQNGGVPLLRRGRTASTRQAAPVRLIHIPTGIVVSCQNEAQPVPEPRHVKMLAAEKLYQIKSASIWTKSVISKACRTPSLGATRSAAMYSCPIRWSRITRGN